MTQERLERKVIIQGIESGMTKLCELSLNRFVSVKTHSISGVFDEFGVKRYATEAIEVLKDDFLEIEGVRAGMAYKWKSETIPDMHVMAIKAYNLFVQKRQDYNNRVKTDLNPIRRSSVSLADFGNSSKVEKHLRRVNLPNLKDVRFILKNDVIKQCKVVGIELEDDDQIKYTVKYKDKENRLMTAHVHIKELYESIEDIFKFLTKNIIKL